MLSDCFIPCSPYLDVREISGHPPVPVVWTLGSSIFQDWEKIGIFLCLGLFSLACLACLSGLLILSVLLS